MVILYITNIFNENLFRYLKKNFTVIYENKKDRIIAIITNKFISIDSFGISFKPRKLAPAKAGIESKKEIFPESTLLKLNNLAAVIVIPALLTPGINASI